MDGTGQNQSALVMESDPSSIKRTGELRRKLSMRRCVRAISGVVALAALSASAARLMARADFESAPRAKSDGSFFRNLFGAEMGGWDDNGRGASAYGRMLLMTPEDLDLRPQDRDIPWMPKEKRGTLTKEEQTHQRRQDRIKARHNSIHAQVARAKKNSP